MKHFVIAALFVCSVLGCGPTDGDGPGVDGGAQQPDAGSPDGVPSGDGDGDGDAPAWTALASLPVGIANNAVTSWPVGEGCMVLSMMGIEAGLTTDDITGRVDHYDSATDAWTAQAPIGHAPVVAAAAVTVGAEVYLLPGYSVAPNFFEQTENVVLSRGFDEQVWTERNSMPHGVDDAVVGVFEERYIIVVGGWAGDTMASVDDVQIYDTQTDVWAMSTAFPGTLVFGHGGAIVGNHIVVFGGVEFTATAPRVVVSDQLWVGTIDPADRSIDWVEHEASAVSERYRPAVGVLDGVLWMSGGSMRGYNFDGLDYLTGAPVTGLDDVFAFDPAEMTWVAQEVQKPSATFDHRGFVACADRLLTVGGMIDAAVTDEVWAFSPGMQ